MKKAVLLLIISLFLIPPLFAEESHYCIYTRKVGFFRKKTEQILLDTQSGHSWLLVKGEWKLIPKEESDDEISLIPKLPEDWAGQPKDIKREKVKRDRELEARAKQAEDIASLARNIAERNIRAKQANEIRALMSDQAEEIKALKQKQEKEIKALMSKQARELNAKAEVKKEPPVEQKETVKEEKKATKSQPVKKKATNAAVAEEKVDNEPPAWF